MSLTYPLLLSYHGLLLKLFLAVYEVAFIVTVITGVSFLWWSWCKENASSLDTVITVDLTYSRETVL